jgi:CubicO group peptidase (beta-lactamase class C family)
VCALNRRQLIRGAAAATVAGSVGALVTAPAAHADPAGDAIADPAVVPPVSPPADLARTAESTVIRPHPTVTPDDVVFVPRRLRRGTPAEAGLLAAPLAQLRADLAGYLGSMPDHASHPSYPGATVLAGRDGVVVLREAVGQAVRYATPTQELPPEQQIAATTDTIYDMASVSKLFTVTAFMQQVERGRVALDTPVARYLPDFAAGGKADITPRHLLTHSSGLPADRPFYSLYPTIPERFAAALATPVLAGTSPGAQYLYSDIGIICLGLLVEHLTGKRLDQAVHAAVIDPLGLKNTGYNPDPRLKPRIAATEYEDYVGRGMVWGSVHDECAWGFGGIAGHAGIFSTVDDMAVFAQMYLNGGQYNGRRILRESTVRQMLVNYNAHLEDAFPDSDRGLGFELDKTNWMGALASPVSFGHTGFTGTSIAVDPLSRTFLILLTNRVHPTRDWGANTQSRRAMGSDLAEAVPVRPLLGGTPWRAQQRNSATVTLTATFPAVPARGTRAGFFIWYDTEPHYDTAYLEASPDGTTWTVLDTYNGFGGRRWLPVAAELAPGTTRLRWRYVQDVSSRGRGVYVDRVTVGGRPLAERDFTADGWSPSRT